MPGSPLRLGSGLFGTLLLALKFADKLVSRCALKISMSRRRALKPHRNLDEEDFKPDRHRAERDIKSGSNSSMHLMATLKVMKPVPAIITGIKFAAIMI